MLVVNAFLLPLLNILVIIIEVFPKTVADPSRPNPAYVVMNSGGIRYDIYKGPFLEDNVYNVCPFADDWVYVADVPYDAAAKLLDAMNGDSAASNYKRKRDLGGLERALHPLKSHHSEEFQTFLERRADDSDDDSQNVTMIPGYTTVDDMGDDGMAINNLYSLHLLIIK